MTSISVRTMEERDIVQAASIHRKILQEGLTTETEYSIEDHFTAFLEHSPNTCMVAEKEGAVVGFIVGDIKEWSFGAGSTGWIEIVGVDPGNMGEGIGKALGEALVSYFREEGLKGVYTSVRWDSGDIIAFFKSIGFDKSSFINLEYKE